LYVTPLGQVTPQEFYDVGGKGANLARLLKAGLPVPGGFCVSTEAYEAHVNLHNIEMLIDEIEASIDQPATRDNQNLGAEIRRAFLTAQIPDAIRSGIEATLHQAGWIGQAVVVRSSSTLEDNSRASFAGQHDSFVNVCGDDQILNAVRACWASLWTRRALVYRLDHGLMSRSPQMAVVIQKMLRPEVSGVVFTADPITSSRTETLITATFGLPDLLVSGLVAPDEYRVKKETFEFSTQRISNKEIESVASPSGGTERVRIARERRRCEALSKFQVQDLARLADKVDRFFGEPQDIEWCLERGIFWILQARPMSFPLVAAVS
jgi:rifampicin phosphotransferase